jgi:hypothetical protein
MIITREQWEAFKQDRYAHSVDGELYALILTKEGVTSLAPVTVIDMTEAEKAEDIQKLEFTFKPVKGA